MTGRRRAELPLQNIPRRDRRSLAEMADIARAAIVRALAEGRQLSGNHTPRDEEIVAELRAEANELRQRTERRWYVSAESTDRDPTKLLEQVIALLEAAAADPHAVRRLRYVIDNAAYTSPEMRDRRLWHEGTMVLTQVAPFPPWDDRCPEVWREIARCWSQWDGKPPTGDVSC